MSIRRYFQQGENSSGSCTINEALRLMPSVSDVVTEENSDSIARGIRAANNKRKPYDRFSTDEDRYVIATYCAQHGPIATVKHFKSKFPNLKESTARNFRDKYRKLLSKELQDDNGQNSVSSIPTSKRGRKLLIGDLDKEVMNFIYNLREVGGVVKIAVAAAKGIINAKNKEILVENGGHVTLGNGWVKSMFKRMNFLRRKKTTSTKPKTIGEVKDQLQRDYHPKYLYSPAVSNGPPAVDC